MIKDCTRRALAKARIAYTALMTCYPLTLEDLEGEVWQPVADGYQVSSFGRIKSFKRKTPKILRPNIKGCGYLTVELSINCKIKTSSVARLVAKAFIPNPNNKREVNHIDGNKFNCHVSNLEWVTPSENTKHAFDNGLAKVLRGVDNGRTSLTAAQVKEIRRLKGCGLHSLAKKFGIGRTTVFRIVNKITFSSV